MKKISQTITALVLGILGVCLSGCDKDEKFTVYPDPEWTEAINPDYSVSMTAVVVLPANLATYAQAEDKLAAFAGDECRGVAYFADNAYYLLIKGSPGEQPQISIRYYSAKNKYIYQSDTDITFETDAVYGTTDEPVTLSLIVTNE